MEIRLSEEYSNNKVAVLILNGRLTAVTAGELKIKMKQLVEDEKIFIILILSEIDFIDSSGLSALVSGLKTAREKGGAIKLVGLNENSKKVFELTRLNRVFDFFDEVGDAVNSLEI